ncbi:hypothetical protein NC797_03815 [Aquibacillus sp. 3ASR75-11]|uniref:Uncharacterized protein n=1 Tax=Terrihalobacillus insolitus TaxID=2950438 RepID=A0A9X3WSW3_9BACI|nr:hypothetical protein [Terrihalobacillus insolitus]MDC3412885.1 hypothetical protein [Terrihalobacillus insolitus]MDC3423636.1 hypothetical protein [Terrihalobacillus insolitus]
MSVSASTNNDNGVDALNQKLEEQKIEEQTGQSLEEGIEVEVGKPLTVEFEDGSSVTHLVEIEEPKTNTKSDFSLLTISGNTYSYTKIYEGLIFGSARIKLGVEGVKFTDYAGRGGSVSVTGAFQNVVDTSWASVNKESTNYKYVGLASNVRVVRARARGDILFNVSGIQKQQTYDFAIEVSPIDKTSVRLISNY